ncbi:MAG: hypothetical protein ACRDWY_13290 [Actinomycetes bacterium]
MSLNCSAFSVIVMRWALEVAYPGGLAAYERDCPNRTFCSDDHLTQVSFMDGEDAVNFVEVLEQVTGLRYREHGRAIDIALISQVSGLVTPCDWLNFTRLGDDTMAWLAGTDPGEPAAAKGALAPPGTRDLTAEEVAAMPTSRTSDGLLTTIDPRTGEVLYCGLVDWDRGTGLARRSGSWFGSRLAERQAANDTPGALAVCEDWVHAWPGQARAWNELGVRLMDNGWVDRAVAAFRRAFELDANLRHVLCNLGAALVEQGALEEGRERLEEATHRDVDDAVTWYARSLAELALHDDVAAAASLRTAYELASRVDDETIMKSADAKLAMITRRT